MKVKNKLITYGVIINVTALILLLLFSADLVKRGAEFSELSHFNKVKENSISFYNRFEDQLTIDEQESYKRDFNLLLQEYAQKKITNDTTIKYSITLLIISIAIVLFLTLVANILTIRNVVKPLDKLRAIMELKLEDIKDFKRDRDLSKYQEIRDLYNSFYGMIEEIENYKRIISERGVIDGWQSMSRAIVHELNNFLMPVGTYLNQVEEGISSERPFEEITENINKLKRSYNQSKNIIANLRNFYNSSGETISDIDLIDELRFIAEGFKVTLVSKIEGKLITSINLLGLNHIVVNLIKNGKEASRDGGEVEVVVESKNSTTTIEVKDYGVGISSDKVDRIFSPGFTTKKQGMGLGLSLVKKIAVDNGWSLDLESEVGKGTTFRLSLGNIS
jgi:signal transduction histidine kinase